jgi:2-isopropylmalate synthase
MKQIRISDVTMKQAGGVVALSFKEKIELAKLLDRLGVSAIEVEGVGESRVDALRVKSIAAAVKNSVVAVPVLPEAKSVTNAWNALSQAKHPRLQVCAPVSPVQMEYLFHKKPDAMLEAISNTVRQCRELCADVEFVADDATRSDESFLFDAVNAAIRAGAGIITLCDTAGAMMPDEFGAFLDHGQFAVCKGRFDCHFFAFPVVSEGQGSFAGFNGQGNGEVHAKGAEQRRGNLLSHDFQG